MARLYSSLPRRSSDGLQSSEAICAAAAIFSSVSGLFKSNCSDLSALKGVGFTFVKPIPIAVQMPLSFIVNCTATPAVA